MTYAKKSPARKTLAAAAALALPAFLLFPGAATANHGYNHYDPHEACESDERDDKVVGGLIGGVIGGVIGNQIASDNARGEGTALGAGVGAIAGVAIADSRVDCDPDYSRGRNYRNTNTYGNGSYTSQPVYQQQPVHTQPRTVYTSPVYTSPVYSAPPRYETYQQPRVVHTNSRYYEPRRKHKRKNKHKYKHSHNNGYYGHRAPVYHQPVRRTGSHYHGDYICHGSH